jgi:ankyrin repeat protein
MGIRVSTRLLVLTAGCFAALSLARAESPLADAAMSGDMKSLRTLLRHAHDIDAAQPDGMTALHWAVHRDDLEMADLLLAAGADVLATNRIGVRPIFLATENGSAAMLGRLLDAGDEANGILTPTGETVLMLTARTGNPAAVELLIDHGADVNARQEREFTPLMFAAAEGHADVIRVLLRHGADPSLATLASTRRERRPAGGMTPLLLAARQGHLAAAQALVEGGADVNECAADDTSPLLIALVNGHYDLGRMLLDRGADPSLADANGRGPLFSVIDLRNAQWSQIPPPKLSQAEHMAMIETLVEAGADLEQAIEDKVAHRGSFDMRWTNFTGGTPFLRAAWNGDIEVMRFLLDHGADPNVVSEKGETALLLLAGAGWPLGQGYIRSDDEIFAALDLLVDDLGQDVNAATEEGVTALMAAVFKGTNEVIDYLVARGADLGAVDNKGRTVLTWARGVAANDGQPPRPQPESEALIRELAKERGVTLAMADPADESSGG